jgi:hypothetical protein
MAAYTYSNPAGHIFNGMTKFGGTGFANMYYEHPDGRRWKLPTRYVRVMPGSCSVDAIFLFSHNAVGYYTIFASTIGSVNSCELRFRLEAHRVAQISFVGSPTTGRMAIHVLHSGLDTTPQSSCGNN